MKKRNVLCSLFGVSLLASVFLAGCSGLADPFKKAKIAFDSSRITCTLAQGTNSEIKSGTMVAENTALYFKAKLPDGQTVRAWTVNGKEKSTAESFLYYVNLKELKLKNGAEITVNFTEQAAQTVPVTFDNKVLAYKLAEGAPNSSDGTSIDSGTSYKVGTRIKFVAKPTKGMMVDHWTVNGNTPNGAYDGKYTHKIQAGEKALNVAFTEKEAKVVVTFDESKITCRYNGDTYSSGKAFELGDTLIFTAKNIDAGKTIENWYVSEKKQEVVNNDDLSQFRYTIDARDIKDDNGKKGIAIKYEVTDEEKVAVKFDEAKIYCVKASGEKWAAGTELTFYAKLADNESVKAWMVNGINGRDITQSGDTSRVSYRVSLNDAKDNDGVIEISYTTVTTTVKVTFDKTAIFCKEVSGKDWPAGKFFEFKAKVPAGEVLEGWYVNGVKRAGGHDTFNYSIIADHAKDGVIEVTRKLYDKVKITFDKTKVQVTKDGTELESGALCAEGDTLQLTAQFDTTNYIFDKWLINGFKADGLWGTFTSYTVNNSNAKTEGTAKVISIDFETKAKPAAPETKITVNFDKTKMSCTRWDNATGSGIAVEPGELDIATLNYNEAMLTFTATLQVGEYVDCWRVNDVKKGYSNNTYQYNLRNAEDDFEGGIRTVEITYDKK